MIYLFWSIFNVLIFVYFIYLLIAFIRKGKTVFKPRYKFVSLFILVVGIIQLMNASNVKDTTNRIEITDVYDKTGNLKLEELVLEENLAFDILMLLNYTKDQNKLVLISSNSELTGFVSGFEWEFKSIATNSKMSNENGAFVATGILKWNLLGLTIYREMKTFKGAIR